MEIMSGGQLYISLAIFIASLQLYTANYLFNNITQYYGICFERYKERYITATNEYAQNHLDCHDHRMIKHAYFTRDMQTERENIENGTAQICENLQNCNKYDANSDFYNCYADKSAENINILIAVHLNASAAVIELSSKYEEAEKTVLLCFIEAQRIYAKETRDALNELTICLKW